MSLNTFLRIKAQLRATKYMCQEGVCGVCIVTLKSRKTSVSEERYWAVPSVTRKPFRQQNPPLLLLFKIVPFQCLTLLNSCLNYEVITCEGIGNKRIGYHPIQERLARQHGSQCGFCSPGFVMCMYSLMCARNNSLTAEEIERSFGGNICRCTGYRPILDAMKSFAVTEQPIPDIEDLFVDKNFPGERDWMMTMAPFAVIAKYTFKDGKTWYWPKNYAEVFEIFNIYVVGREEFMLVAGNTAYGAYRTRNDVRHFIDTGQLYCLREHFMSDKQLSLGAGLSLNQIMDVFREAGLVRGFEYCKTLWHYFQLVANVPVRNVSGIKKHLLYPFLSGIYCSSRFSAGCHTCWQHYAEEDLPGLHIRHLYDTGGPECSAHCADQCHDAEDHVTGRIPQAEEPQGDYHLVRVQVTAGGEIHLSGV